MNVPGGLYKHGSKSMKNTHSSVGPMSRFTWSGGGGDVVEKRSQSTDNEGQTTLFWKWLGASEGY